MFARCQDNLTQLKARMKWTFFNMQISDHRLSVMTLARKADCLEYLFTYGYENGIFLELFFSAFFFLLIRSSCLTCDGMKTF